MEEAAPAIEIYYRKKAGLERATQRRIVGGKGRTRNMKAQSCGCRTQEGSGWIIFIDRASRNSIGKASAGPLFS